MAGASERGVRGRIRAIADFAIPRSDARNPGRKSPARPFNPTQSSIRCTVKAEIERIFSASSYEVHPLAVRSLLSKRIHSRSSTSHAGEIKEAVYQVFIGGDTLRMITSVGRYYARYLYFESCLFLFFFLSFSLFLFHKNICEKMKYRSCIWCTHTHVHACVCNACVTASQLQVTQDSSLRQTRSIFWTFDAFDSHSSQRSRMLEYRSDVHIVSDIDYKGTHNSVLFTRLSNVASFSNRVH